MPSASPLVTRIVLAAASISAPCQLFAGDAGAVKCETAATARVQGLWRLQDTLNFCVCCPSNMDPAAIARACESLREELGTKWLGDNPATLTWKSRCYVVVHPSIASYVREVGEAGRGTLGSSLIKTDHGRVVSRRIDLRGDVAEPLRAALPHEMTHVVLADAFPGDELPRWADEGMAMQADPPDKLAGHARDLDAAVAGGTAFRVPELFIKENYPMGDRRAVFYAQSASLVSYLAARGQPSQFVEFAHCAARDGYDAALREIYGIHDVGQLEQFWRTRSALALKRAPATLSPTEANHGSHG
jgi:peptidase MA superfamily protein